jgi:hypothetical protein
MLFLINWRRTSPSWPSRPASRATADVELFIRRDVPEIAEEVTP